MLQERKMIYTRVSKGKNYLYSECGQIAFDLRCQMHKLLSQSFTANELHNIPYGIYNVYIKQVKEQLFLLISTKETSIEIIAQSIDHLVNTFYSIFWDSSVNHNYKVFAQIQARVLEQNYEEIHLDTVKTGSKSKLNSAKSFTRDNGDIIYAFVLKSNQVLCDYGVRIKDLILQAMNFAELSEQQKLDQYSDSQYDYFIVEQQSIQFIVIAESGFKQRFGVLAVREIRSQFFRKFNKLAILHAKKESLNDQFQDCIKEIVNQYNQSNSGKFEIQQPQSQTLKRRIMRFFTICGRD